MPLKAKRSGSKNCRDFVELDVVSISEQFVAEMKGENRKTVMNSSDKELTSCKKQKGESRGTNERESKKRMNRITELMIARMTRQTTEMRKKKKSCFGQLSISDCACCRLVKMRFVPLFVVRRHCRMDRCECIEDRCR